MHQVILVCTRHQCILNYQRDLVCLDKCLKLHLVTKVCLRIFMVITSQDLRDHSIQMGHIPGKIKALDKYYQVKS